MKRSGLQLQEKFSLTWLLSSYIVCDFVIDFIIVFDWERPTPLLL
jgi:hypothetical protein